MKVNSNLVFNCCGLLFVLFWSGRITGEEMGEQSTTLATTLVTNLNLTFNGDYNRASVHTHDKVVVCYVASWAFYRKPSEEASYDIGNIEPGLCTHLIYSFAKLNPESFRMEPFDSWLDLKNEKQGGGHDWYRRFVGFKKSYPHLKVLLAVGGWEEGAKKYSDMAASPEHRRSFAQSALEMIHEYGFDGLDLDWEYPGHEGRGGRPEDKDNFTELLKELRRLFDNKTAGLLLTSAFGAAPRTAKSGYDLKEVSKYLDHLHLMCYDYHGTWDGKTGHNAPLRGSLSLLPEGQKEETVEDSVDYYLGEGVPPEKLVLGVPFYGRTFLLKYDSVGDGLGEGAESVGFQGPFSKADGFLGYNEIVKILLGNRSEWKVYWDRQAEVPFMRNGKKWVSFDNPDSIRKKMEFLSRKGLKGAMVWSVDTDDFHGYSAPHKFGVKSVLLRTINYSLYQIQRDSNEVRPNNSKPPAKRPGGSGTNSGGRIVGGLAKITVMMIVILGALYC